MVVKREICRCREIIRAIKGKIRCASTVRKRVDHRHTFLSARERDDIVPGGRVLRCIRRNYDDNLRETEGGSRNSPGNRNI